MASPVTVDAPDKTGTPPPWERKLNRRLPLFGHRNWIVVADAAYPAQSNSGIETIVAGTDQLSTAKTVLDRIAQEKHIRAKVYTDLELDFVEETDAPGIAEYRHHLRGLLAGATTKQLPHEQILAKLDQCGQVFKVLVIKTSLTLPYTSVFIELDCGYWSAEAENRLRAAMQT